MPNHSIRPATVCWGYSEGESDEGRGQGINGCLPLY